MTRHTWTLTVLFCLTSIHWVRFSFAQYRDTISAADFVRALVDADNVVSFQSTVVESEFDLFEKLQRDELVSPNTGLIPIQAVVILDSIKFGNRTAIHKETSWTVSELPGRLDFKNSFEANQCDLALIGCVFGSVAQFKNCILKSDSNRFDRIVQVANKDIKNIGSPLFRSSIFKEGLFIQSPYVSLIDCKFIGGYKNEFNFSSGEIYSREANFSGSYNSSGSYYDTSVWKSGSQLFPQTILKLKSPKEGLVFIESCEFLEVKPWGGINVATQGDFISFKSNKFKCKLCINGFAENRFEFIDNEVAGGLNMEDFTLSEKNNLIPWNQISGFQLLSQSKLIESTSPELSIHWSGNNDKLISTDWMYRKLMKVYANLGEVYRRDGDRESSNGSFSEMKLVETSRLKFLYSTNPRFETYFRWKLNQFLNFFTDYGTNPAKAVIKSIWVILIFSIFYLFFPSDWDVSNRSTLLKRMKELVSKNREKSFMATLGFVSYGGFIHVLNAITLSLNAFTTLGFGDIPTHGAARYVTIVQGFIGWFLLTIFSVSLINQVLG